MLKVFMGEKINPLYENYYCLWVNEDLKNKQLKVIFNLAEKSHSEMKVSSIRK